MTENAVPTLAEWDTVTLKWAGVHIDGSPVRGKIAIRYDGTVPMLDDGPELPLSMFQSTRTFPIVEKRLVISDSEGGLTIQTIGYCEFVVPASNDPDILGGGGTYTFEERLVGGGGREGITFVADRDAPNNVIWLNEIAGNVPPAAGVPYTIVQWSDLAPIVERIETLEESPGGIPEMMDLTILFENGLI